MRQSEQLLRQRERRGLLTSYIVRIVSIIILVVGHLTTHHNEIEIVMIGLFGGLFLILLSIFFYFAYTDRLLIVSGWVGVLTDVAIMLFLPYTWYTSVSATTAVPYAYLVKTSLPLWALCFIAASGLALRWQYPVAVAAVFIIEWELIMQLVLGDSDTVITKDFVEALMGSAVIPGYYRLPEAGALILGALVAAIAYSYRNSIKKITQLEVTNAQMGRYFSPKVASRMAEDGEDFMGLAGRNQEVAVLFCDIRNFTSISEALSPEETVALLRSYHGRMVHEIFAGSGTIDKFLGDGIMVTFGTPDTTEQDAKNAVRTGIRMRLALQELNAERTKQDLPPLENGIGIHFGAVVAGNIGTESRMEYTVIGDTVNAAARIEAACKKLDRPLLISDQLFQKLSANERASITEEFGVEWEKLASLLVKGKSEALNLYAVGHRDA